MMDALREVNPADAQRLAGEGVVLLDVREDVEWSTGRAPGATHIPLAELPDRIDDIPSGSLVVCVCRSGGRSKRAAVFLLEQGFAAANMEGGMMAWAEGGGPLECDDGEPEIA
jgi:rhodanese-related sulfurtransferase